MGQVLNTDSCVLSYSNENKAQLTCVSSVDLQRSRIIASMQGEQEDINIKIWIQYQEFTERTQILISCCFLHASDRRRP